MAATPSLFPAADGPLPSRRADAAADRNSSAAPGTRRAARPVASDPEASYSQIPLDGHTKSRRRHRSVTRGDDPKPGTCAPDAPDTTSSPGQMKTRHLLRHIQRALARVIGELTSSGIGYSPRACVAAVLEMQQALETRAWPSGEQVQVRMGVHTGEASRAAAGLVGLDVHRAARVAAVGY